MGIDLGRRSLDRLANPVNFAENFPWAEELTLISELGRITWDDIQTEASQSQSESSGIVIKVGDNLIKEELRLQ